MLDLGMLIARVAVGLTLAAHGYNHLFGPGGVSGTARWFGQIGLRPPRVHALLSGLLELGAGLSLVAGLLTPLACAGLVGTMSVAGVVAHRRNGFFVFNEGFEYVLLLATMAVVIALVGPGAVSLDHLLGWQLSGPGGVTIAAGGGLLGAAVLLATSWRPRLES